MILSPSETRIVELMTEGLSNREIAKELGLSIKGVKYHKTNIFAKEGVQTSAQLIIKKLSDSVSKEEIKAFKEILK